MKPIIQVKLSRPHLHPTRELINKLFSRTPGVKRMLSVPGHWVYDERVTIEGPNGNCLKVAMVGAPRGRVQLALHASHAPFLGLMNLPRRLSGDLSATTGFYAIGPDGREAVDSGAIVEAPHIHLPERLGFYDNELVDIDTGLAKVEGLPVKVVRDPLFRGEVHIDTEEARALDIWDGNWAAVSRSKSQAA